MKPSRLKVAQAHPLNACQATVRSHTKDRAVLRWNQSSPSTSSSGAISISPRKLGSPVSPPERHSAASTRQFQEKPMQIQDVPYHASFRCGRQLAGSAGSCFFSLTGCGGSLGYRQSIAKEKQLRSALVTSVARVFFLQCRIAQDSCGHVPARTKSKRSQQELPWETKPKRQPNTTPKPTKATNKTRHNTGELK